MNPDWLLLGLFIFWLAVLGFGGIIWEEIKRVFKPTAEGDE